MKKEITVILLLISIVFFTKAQERSRVINPAVPFLLVTADARSAGMGELGVATSNDIYSQQWNPAKYVFTEHNINLGMSYTPYLTGLANDVSLLNVIFNKKINQNSAFTVGLRYFGLGEIELRNNAEDQAIIGKPNEMALDISYGLKLSKKFAMSVAGRYIRSNIRLQQGLTDSSSANSFSVDIAGFYRSNPINYEGFDGVWRFGFNISNIGPKLDYDNSIASQRTGNFLPANLKIGTGFDFILNTDNKLSVNTEINKLLVPTPQGNSPEEIAAYKNIGFMEGVFKSFTDAPDGFSEELKELSWALGLEYLYRERFALRTGYFNESALKGARKFFTLGSGFRYDITQIDFSYLFSFSSIRNPLENTLRFSLTFNLGKKGNIL